MNAILFGGGRPDGRLALLTSVLVIVGVMMVFGASSYEASLTRGSEYWYLLKHGFRTLLAVGAALIAMSVPYRVSCILAGRVLFWVAVGLLSMTIIGGSAVAENAGIARWISIFGMTFQPVEIAKLALVLGLPLWIEEEPTFARDFRGGFLKVMWRPGLVVLLLALQPNFGSAVALALMSLAVAWVAGAKLRWFGSFAAAGAMLIWIGATHVSKLQGRVNAWLELLLGDASPRDAFAYQPFQGLVAIGSGGWTGVGVGESAMKYQFLPECHTDFIFAILGEELGFAGGALLLILLGLWLGRVFKIAHRSRDGLAYLCAVAVGAMVFSYAALNLMVVTGLMPVAGLPLPFLSYGGTAMITNLAAVGVLLNISRQPARTRDARDRWKGSRWR